MSAPTSCQKVLDFVKHWTDLCKPKNVQWCDGSEEEAKKLFDEMVAKGTAIKLNQEKRPGCYLFRSDPRDVARVEKEAPADMQKRLTALYDGCMEGRTHVHHPISHGSNRFQHCQERYRNHRLCLCCCQHAYHDPRFTKDSRMH
ncbi:phosphoenolpyruvate carboxykinase (GTP) [Histomonas meleagridis]|uniref:phosphoenolpyruvate carboxykinase (GTP) n=1 Tax=Histomonas meleagridis TaxID=135588 RepID=UPI0035599B02|nr:phosphoenolpyruvate carboxykinase (GTP) [Histomonas meleagridis]